MADTRGRIFGHPVHPATVALPSALFPASFLADLAAVVTGDVFWWRAAFWLIAVGLVGTLLAIVTGLLEFRFVTDGDAMRTARRHRAMGFAVLTLYLVVFVLHAGPMTDTATRWAAVGTNFVGQVFLSYQGVWGGWLVYRHRVGLK